MAISRNPLVARLHMVRAWLTGQRPSVLERRLLNRVRATVPANALSPRQAWLLYLESMRTHTFMDNGWLVQFGVYDFTGPALFRLGLVRQFNTLETWNDELIQLELTVYHPPTPALRVLGSWHDWSFEHASLEAFARACERNAGIAALLMNESPDWTWRLECGET